MLFSLGTSHHTTLFYTTLALKDELQTVRNNSNHCGQIWPRSSYPVWCNKCLQSSNKVSRKETLFHRSAGPRVCSSPSSLYLNHWAYCIVSPVSPIDFGISFQFSSSTAHSSLQAGQKAGIYSSVSQDSCAASSTAGNEAVSSGHVLLAFTIGGDDESTWLTILMHLSAGTLIMLLVL